MPESSEPPGDPYTGAVIYNTGADTAEWTDEVIVLRCQAAGTVASILIF
jgi:hypothetical protein